MAMDQMYTDALRVLEEVKAERDALAAHVERIKDAWWIDDTGIHDKRIEHVRLPYLRYEAVNQAIMAAPTTSLARRDASMALVPRTITAESGHKAGMIGEFYETVNLMCEACDGDGDDEHDDSGVCSECDGAGEYAQVVPVTWNTIKAIHRRVVEISEVRQAEEATE